MDKFDGSSNSRPIPMKARDIWPQLKALLNLPDECVKAIRIDIDFTGGVEIEVRKYAVAPPSFRETKVM